MKKGLIVLLLILSSPLFAQTDYMFVLEKPAGSQDVSVSIFQTLAAALITGNDTLSAVSFTNNATYLFSPLSGDLPNVAGLAGEKIRSDPLKGAVDAVGISAGINLANEQAAAWGRTGADKKLIIITGSGSANKDPTIEKLTAFSGIFHISVDVTLDSVEPIAKITEQDGILHAWAVDTKNPTPDVDFVSLAEGIYNVVHANNSKIEKVEITDSTRFSAGNLLQQVRKSVVLIKNTSGDPVGLLDKTGKSISISSFQQSTFSVIQTEAISGGEYTVENGEVVLVLVQKRISFVVFAVAVLVFLIVLAIIIAGIIKTINEGRKKGRPVYEVSYQKGGRDSGMIKASLCKKTKYGKDGYFQSGVPIKSIVLYMNIRDTLDSKVVDDNYPCLVYREEQDAWFVEYNPSMSNSAVVEVDIVPGSDSGWSMGGDISPAQPDNEYMIEEDDLPKNEQVQGSIFKIKRIFKNDLENKLVLTRKEY